MENVSVKIKLSFSDFFDFQRKHASGRISFVLGFLFLMGAINLCGYFFWPGSDLYTLLPSIFFMLMPLIVWIALRFNSRRAFFNDSLIQKENTYLINDAGIELSSENTFVKMSWSDVYKTRATKTFFAIYLSPAKAYILPKRFFKEDELDFVTGLLNKKVQRKKSPYRFLRPAFYTLLAGLLAFYVYPVFSSLEVNPYYKEGYKMEKNGYYEGAIVEYNKAIKLDPSMASIYLHRAYSQGELGNYEEEIADCTKAIELDKNYASAYSNRGYAKFQTGDSIGACLDFQIAVNLGDKHAVGALKEFCGKAK